MVEGVRNVYLRRLQKNPMRFIAFQKHSPAHNFRLNKSYFEQRVEHVRVYGWKFACVSLPRSKKQHARVARVPVCERNTGGGLLFHKNDISFAVTIKKNKATRCYLDELKIFFMRFFKKIIVGFKPQQVSKKLTKSIFCRDFRNEYEIMFRNEKIFSVAVRIEKDFLLIEGSVFAESRYVPTKRDTALLLYGFKRFYGGMSR